WNTAYSSSNNVDAKFTYSIKNGASGETSPTPATVTIHRMPQSPSTTFVGNVNGDQQKEILDFRPMDGVINEIQHHYATNTTTVKPWGAIPSVSGQNASVWLSPITGDFNGDGRMDLAARDGMTGQWIVWLAGASPGSNGLINGQPWGSWDTGISWS